MDYFKLSKKIEKDLNKMTVDVVSSIRRRMISQIVDIELAEPVEEIKKWYRKGLIGGMPGYFHDELSTLIFHYLNTVGDHLFGDTDDDWKDEAHFWSELN